MATDEDQNRNNDLLGPIQLGPHHAELAQLRRELAEKTIQLAELEDFAHIVAHDLKEPLRAISNYAQFVVEDFADELPEEGRAKLLIVERHATLMKERIDALLALTRAGSPEGTIEDVDVEALVAEAVQSLHVLVDESSAEVTVSAAIPSVRCNPTRVRQVLQNLVANGIKYNESAHKKVRVGTLADATPPTFFVADNGIGIQPEHQGVVFQVFRRLHDRAAYGGGTGMGLTIAQRIVARHGGRIWLTSGPANGTTVFFTLEAEVAHSPSLIARRELDSTAGARSRGAKVESGDARV